MMKQDHRSLAEIGPAARYIMDCAYSLVGLSVLLCARRPNGQNQHLEIFTSSSTERKEPWCPEENLEVEYLDYSAPLRPPEWIHISKFLQRDL